MSQNCLLSDATFPITLSTGEVSYLTLPGVLATLSETDIVSFDGLAAHQRQAWFQFLTQLAAIALHNEGVAEAPASTEVWDRLLRKLAPAPAWSLLVEDLTEPAFLQPPVRKGGLKAYSPLAETPDALDILVTAKNHDLKSFRFRTPEPHHWVFALLNLQTLQGFLGAGNYGIARMNGGFASRPLVDIVEGPPSWGGRFRRGVDILLNKRHEILTANEDYFRDRDGLALLWVEPWDDEVSLPLTDLDPYFVEICRRIRLVRETEDGPLVAYGRTSKVARVAAKQAAGNLGDPWIPITADNNATALTVGAGGFHYRKVADILFDPKKFQLRAALDPRPEDRLGALQVHFAVLVRGQGKTDGLYERFVAATKHGALKRLKVPEERKVLHEISQQMIIKDIDKGAMLAHKMGLLILLQGGKDDEQPDFRDRRAGAWLDLLDRRIDEMFFDHLWAQAEAEFDGDDEQQHAAQRAWQVALGAETERVFAVAVDQLPSPLMRRERARARAHQVFFGILRKALPMTKADPPDTGTEPEVAA